MSRTFTRSLSAAAVAALALTGLVAPAQADNGKQQPTATAAVQKAGKAYGKTKNTPKNKGGSIVDYQLLAFNDFHGQLEPTTMKDAQGNSFPVGGAAYLAAHLDAQREGEKISTTVSLGDNVGGSPFASAVFYDEPTILALNEMDLTTSAVGNHEFDLGYQELLRKENGGCIDDGDGANGKNSCPTGEYFPGTVGWDYIATNIRTADGERLLAPYTIEKERGTRVAYVGVTLESTPDIVSAAGIQGLTFEDEVKAANEVVPEIQAMGVEAIVLLLHQGGASVKDGSPANCADGGALTGPVVDINAGLDPAYDVILSSHTHNAYVCELTDPAGQPRLITQSLSSSRMFTELNLRYNRATKDFVREGATAENHLVTHDIAPDPAVQSIIDEYKPYVAAIANTVVGTITGDLIHDRYTTASTAIGNLIADAQLNDPTVVGPYAEPQIAFMNPGGIRNSLYYAASGPESTNGIVRYEEAFSVQPFGNYVVSMDMTGAQIYDVLEQQWSGKNAPSVSYIKFLQVSDGFEYRYTLDAAGIPQLVPGSVMLNGTPIADDNSTTYRVVANSFLADGGDGFAAFATATNKYYGGLDIDALITYLKANSPYTPNPEVRFGPAA